MDFSVDLDPLPLQEFPEGVPQVQGGCGDVDPEAARAASGGDSAFEDEQVAVRVGGARARGAVNRDPLTV